MKISTSTGQINLKSDWISKLFSEYFLTYLFELPLEKVKNLKFWGISKI
jgi:hypothetical protein